MLRTVCGTLSPSTAVQHRARFLRVSGPAFVELKDVADLKNRAMVERAQHYGSRVMR